MIPFDSGVGSDHMVLAIKKAKIQAWIKNKEEHPVRVCTTIPKFD